MPDIFEETLKTLLLLKECGSCMAADSRLPHVICQNCPGRHEYTRPIYWNCAPREGMLMSVDRYLAENGGICEYNC